MNFGVPTLGRVAPAGGRREEVVEFVSGVVPDYRVKMNLGVALAALVLLTPFVANNFLRGRVGIGAASTAIIMILGFNAWSILKGKMINWVTPFVLVPAVIFFLVTCFRQQGALAAYWCYPAIISFYFMLSQVEARVANVVFLFIVLPEGWQVLANDLGIRFAVSLFAVSLFSAISTCIMTDQQRRLRRMAVRDPLTGVNNRMVLDESLDRASQQRRRTGRPMTLISLDLDHFKEINDEYGHEAGDEVLRSVGQVLRERLRGADQVFRLGGEEFLVVLHDTDEQRGVFVAHELRRAIAALDLLPTGNVTASFGVAELAETEGWRDWLRRSDRLLYRAKAAGRDRVVSDLSPPPSSWTAWAGL